MIVRFVQRFEHAASIGTNAWFVHLQIQNAAAAQDARELDAEPNGWPDMGTQREYKRSGRTCAART